MLVSSTSFLKPVISFIERQSKFNIIVTCLAVGILLGGAIIWSISHYWANRKVKIEEEDDEQGSSRLSTGRDFGSEDENFGYDIDEEAFLLSTPLNKREARRKNPSELKEEEFRIHRPGKIGTNRTTPPVTPLYSSSAPLRRNKGVADLAAAKS